MYKQKIVSFIIIISFLIACTDTLSPPPPPIFSNQIVYAALSPDQTQIAYFLGEKEQESVVIFDLVSKASKRVFSLKRSNDERLATVFWWRDTKTLILKKIIENKKEQLFVVNQESLKATEVYKSENVLTHIALAEKQLYFVDQNQKQIIKEMDLSSGAIQDFVTVPFDFYERFDFELFNVEGKINVLFRMFKGNKKGKFPDSFQVQQSSPQVVDYYLMAPDKKITPIESMKDLSSEFLFLGGGLSFDGKKSGYVLDGKSHLIDLENDKEITSVDAKKAKWVGNERFISEIDGKLLFYQLKDNQAESFKELTLDSSQGIGDYFYLSQPKQILLVSRNQIYLNELEGDTALTSVLETSNGLLRLLPSNKTALAIFNPAPVAPDFKGELPLPILYQWNSENKQFDEVTKGAIES